MMKKLFFILFCPILLFAQAPVIEWQKAYGGEENDFSFTILKTKLGGYLIVGSSNSDISYEKAENSISVGEEYNSYDVWVVKVNEVGIIEWQQTIGAIENDFTISAIETRDGNYLIRATGSSQISGDKTVPGGGYWIFKINTIGDIMWQIGFDAINTPTWPGENYYGGFNLTQMVETADNGLLFAGTLSHQGCCIGLDIPNRAPLNSTIKSTNDINPDCSGSDILLVKFDSEGNYLWEKEIRANNVEELITLNQTVDGGLIIGAVSNSTVSFDKTESSYITDFSNNCELMSVNVDMWIIKTNCIGDIEWQNTIGGNGVDYLRSLHITPSGYTILAQSDSTISGDKIFENASVSGDIWQVNIDEVGNIVSQNNIVLGDDNYNINFHRVFKMNQNQELFIDSSRGNMDGETILNTVYELSKFNQEGNMLWNRVIDTTPQSGIGDMTFAPDGGIIALLISNAPVGGDKTEFCRGESDYWLVKFEPEVLSTNLTSLNDIKVYPNPTTKEITIDFAKKSEDVRLKLYNVLGQLVSSNSFTNLQSINYPIADEKGIYFLSIETNESAKQVVKVIKE